MKKQNPNTHFTLHPLEAGKYLVIAINNTENDIDEAESWYKRAIQASGEKEGINELIKLYDNEGWEDEALELCERYGRDIEEIREDWSLI